MWNTNNTDRNGVNKQETHTPSTSRKITLENRESNYESGCFWMSCCFLIAQKKQAMTSPFFKTWDLSLHRNQHLFEKILHVNELQVKKVSLNFPEFLWKIVLSRTWKKVLAISATLCRFFEKSKNTWFLHACRYIKKCNEFLNLKYSYMRLQNI